MTEQDIDYTFDDRRLRGFFAHDEAQPGPRPGVLVVHDAGGLGEHIKEKARRLAKLGYAAFVLDLWGDGKTVSDGMRRIGELGQDVPRWRGVLHAGLAVLASRSEVDASRLAAIGYCFGGTSVYELARSGADLRGVVGFHSRPARVRPRTSRARCWRSSAPTIRSSRPMRGSPSRRR